MSRAPLLLALLAAAGCRRAEDAPAAPASVPPPPPAALLFDPATVAAGDSVGGFRLARADFRRASDSVLVGTATFEGGGEVAGAYRPHPDDPAVPCLFADAASAARLPRLAHDARRGWLCFSNPARAVAALGPPDGRAVRVVVDGFAYVYERSDVNNAARFVRALPAGAR